jgi:hypothetical protein
MSWPLDPWWAPLTPGETVALAFVKLDRVGSTLDWRELSDPEVMRRRARFISGIEQLGQDFGAVQPLHWQGDGVLLVFPCRDEAELVLAWHAARALWERQTFELNMPTRFALHAAADVAWEPDTGKLAHPAIDLCGHLEHDAPEKAVAVSEDVFLALPESERRELGWLGVTKRDGLAAYVFPAASAQRRKADAFADDAAGKLWRSFRDYANSATVRRLRYAGLRLTKKEPPSLDVRRVFVAPHVSVRRSAPDLLDDEIAAEARIDESEAVAAPAGAGLRPARASDKQAQDAARRYRLPRTEPDVLLADALRRSRALVVLGEPGAGKTTLLRWLAVVAAGGRLTLSRETALAERLLPLPVSVGRLAEIRAAAGGEISVIDALARYCDDRSVGPRDELAAFLRSALDAGECLVLLDGLDEVKSADRRAISEWLESFAAQAARNRFVVTSRPAGYAGFALPNGVEVTLQPFDDAQVERYVAEFVSTYLAWETNAEQPALAEQQARDLLEALGNSPRLRDLARNPFLLSVLALIHRAEGRLPRHRVQAYHVFAQALCETWGSARRLVAAPSQPDIAYEEEALPVLGELAIAIHAEYPDGLAPEAWVLSTLERALVERRGVPQDEARRAAREFLDRAAERAGILVERANGHWGFLHLTFQEFFVAAGLHAQERFEEEVFAHLFDPRWEEVIRLGVGHLALVQGRPEAARRIVRKVLDYRLEGDLAWITDILKKQIPLAALLAAEAGEALSPTDREHVVQALSNWLLTVPPSPVVLAGSPVRMVRELRESLLGEQLLDHFTAEFPDEDTDAPLRYVVVLQALESDRAVPVLARALNSGGWERLAACEALAALRTPLALRALLSGWREGGEGDNVCVVHSVADWPDPLVEAALIDWLRLDRSEYRVHAAVALLGTRPDVAIPELQHTLYPELEHVRLPTPPFTHAAVRYILAALPDLEPLVQRVVVATLVRAARRYDPSGLASLLLNSDLDAVRTAARLESVRDRDQQALDRAATLRPLFQSPETQQRVEEIRALATLQRPELDPEIVKAFHDDTSGVRTEAWNALWRLSEAARTHDGTSRMPRA